ncbi:hypothetical protein DU508_22675 [Pedobacter chinensis]|uniref:Nucleotide-diphospho-sugar transferase n=1 Tax=Pedobacter chinensis TaxID=2282421 RepID=A0A369PSP3_9SPHI|nr:hypothetical protein [Pedobacter chinensis]RDC54295.1 hypothetical protein DU508_22675 [Pedobacter chinensis]
MKKTPVLLITFSRPETTQYVFEAIRDYKPEKLYIFSDGPRTDRYDSDSTKINETRNLLAHVDWDCEVVTRFLFENQGCGAGVSGAISWAFETTERLIILEDDCLPSQSFFTFCDHLLEEYAIDDRVMHIAGTRWNEEFKIEGNKNYFFSKYGHIWGWATWKRAWQTYDFQMKDWPEFDEKRLLDRILDNYFPLVKRWQYMFNDIYNQKLKHTWDYQWQFAIFKGNGLCITPIQNLITNIGDVGEHFSEATSAHHRVRAEIVGDLSRPEYFHSEYKFDAYHGRKFFLGGRSRFKILYDQIFGKLMQRSMRYKKT